MRIHIIACRVFTRELNYLSAQSSNTIDITWIGRGLHNEPGKLQKRLCDAVEGVSAQLETGELECRPDYIVLCYGLCSNGVVGIRCRDIPIVVPRTDDCIALFLGSQARYLEEFSKAAGTYWLNNGWVEQGQKIFSEEDIRRRKWLEYAEKYGEDNADYLLEVESGWMKSYSALGYIHSDVFDSGAYRLRAQQDAAQRGWTFRELHGDLRLLRQMTEGTWNDEEFLILKPGETIAPEYSGLKVKAVREA